MSSAVDAGALRGRPFGGVMTLISRKLQNCTKVLCTNERYVIVLVGNLLVCNVYFPRSSSRDRLFVYEELIETLTSWMQLYCDYEVVIGGDFNTNLDIKNPASDLVNRFVSESSLYRCDVLSGIGNFCTYYNDALQR